MRRFFWLLLACLLGASSCTLWPRAPLPGAGAPPPSPTADTASPLPTARPPTTLPPGRCTPTLPQTGVPASAYTTVIEAFDLVAPSGNRIYGLVRRPDPATYPDLCFPAVILVPGGINPGRMLAHGYEARLLAEAGVVVVTFNAEGRVDRSEEDIASEGTEDFNGYRHQDGLCTVVQWTIDRQEVMDENVGVLSQSYGITMAAGCAGRHPEVPIRYIVDGEGPPDSFVTCHEPWSLDGDASNDNHETIHGILGHYSTYRDASPENAAFWAEREAIRFIGAFQGRYLRLQAEWDHAQPPSRLEELAAFTLPPLWWQNKHAMDMVGAALAGGVPWVRVNLAEQGNAPNARFDAAHPPVYLPGTLGDQAWDVRAVLEMVRVP